MKELLFGTAGTPVSAKKRGSVEGIQRIRELGLGCMELEFVRGVRMKEGMAERVRATAEAEGVTLSVHAPYYINLNSAEDEKIEASIERIYQSARIGALCGASSIVFHPAYYLKQSSEEVLERVSGLLGRLASRLEDEGINAVLRPETTGKPTQFGDLEETLMIASAIEGVMPCIDFSHLHARSSGEYNTIEEFRDVLVKVEEYLGREGLEDMHCHVSGIEYGNKGEKNHLVLRESDYNYTDLMAAFREFDVKGLVICESPNLEGDALLLQDTFRKAEM
ncbi:Endonuclease IV [Methanococcoides vulcani]|uniref:Endonuclease IV n=1 Tax=Methanococcoides vulcani TaxID=1353158 RepID=A0A1H9Z5Z1_9EURY|nr:TIM barrel protein [Methanococcoides vulcani]SES76845.1 Endonuclease IV [Methanococcoides vulcani]